MADISSITPQNVSFLCLPRELRLAIYTNLFTDTTPIKVEPALSHRSDYYWIGSGSENGTSAGPISRMAPNTHPLSGQILRTNKQIYDEAVPLLYSSNSFDCTTRDGVKLLTLAIPQHCFHGITSLHIDWDQLLPFSYELAKPEFVYLTASIRTLTLIYWRTRVLGGSSMLWRDSKTYERNLLQAALAIVEKSTKLRVLAQHAFGEKLSRHARAEKKAKSILQNPDHEVQSTPSTSRIKWRILAAECHMREDEDPVDLNAELFMLNENRKKSFGGAVHTGPDPLWDY